MLNILRSGSFLFQTQPFVTSSGVKFNCPVMHQGRRGIRDQSAIGHQADVVKIVARLCDSVASNDICNGVTKVVMIAIQYISFNS